MDLTTVVGCVVVYASDESDVAVFWNKGNTFRLFQDGIEVLVRTYGGNDSMTIDGALQYANNWIDELARDDEEWASENR